MEVSFGILLVQRRSFDREIKLILLYCGSCTWLYDATTRGQLSFEERQLFLSSKLLALNCHEGFIFRDRRRLGSDQHLKSCCSIKRCTLSAAHASRTLHQGARVWP
jgi:hypothetical protein